MNRNPLHLPANLASAKPEELFEAIAANINDVDVAESTQRNYVIRCLAALGHGRSPDILTGQLDGSRVRLYIWRETSIGDVVLVTGPSFRGKLVKAADIQGTPEEGFWFAAIPDASAAKRHVDAFRDRTTQHVASSAARAIARAEEAPAPAPAPAPARHRAPPAPRTPRAAPAPVDTAAADKAELKKALADLFG